MRIGLSCLHLPPATGHLPLLERWAVGDRRGRVEQGDADEVVDVDPFGDRMLAAGAGAVGDRRDAAVGREAVAVVDERLGAAGQGCPARSPRSTAGTSRPAGRPGRGRRRRGSASSAGRSWCRCRRRGWSSRSRKSRSTASGSVPGSHRRVPSSQASWGYWLKISPEWIWPMKTLAGPQTGCDRGARARRRAGRAARPARRRRRSRSARRAGRITSWTGGPSRRMTAFQVAEPRPAIGSKSQSGSGSSTASP